MTELLRAENLHAGYGAVKVVHGLDIEVKSGEVVAVLGPNGAGKTTTLLTLAGAIPSQDGTIFWKGEPISAPLHKRTRYGLALVTEERSVFFGLTVQQNLAVAKNCDPEKAYALFPELEEIKNRRAGLLSGGEQQMLTLARSLARPTELLLADELSLGLAQRAVGRLLTAVRKAADDGLGVLLVEQHVNRVLDIADRVIVLRNGDQVFEGTATEARGRLDELRDHYLSAGPATSSPLAKTAQGPPEPKSQTKEMS